MSALFRPASLRAERLGQFLLVRFTGRSICLGEQHRHLLEQQVLHFFEDRFPRPEIVFDISNVILLSGADLAALVSMRERLARRGQRLALTGVCDHILELFEVTGLAPEFDLHATGDAYPLDEPLLHWDERPAERVAASA